MKVATGTRARVLAACVSLVVVLSGCAPTGDESQQIDPVVEPFPVLQTYPDIDVLENLDFGAGADAEGRVILLDVCLPQVDARPASVSVGPAAETAISPSARPVVVSVHGGSWRQGDKANLYWRSVCQWLASEGFVSVSVNYRLAPENPFPAGIDDVRRAVSWLRADAQVERFGIDPERIGAFGGSAGGNLVSLLGLDGGGDLTGGPRVAAVVNLSGPIDLTTDGFALGGVVSTFRQVQLDYLGCASYTACPQARAASPLYSVSEGDPPFFVAHSLDEVIPVEQSDALVEALREAGVDTTYVTVEGKLHSIAMLDDAMRVRIIDFLKDKLGS